MKLTCHRFIDQLRRNRTAVAREFPLGDIAKADEPLLRLPSPSEVVEADELARRMLSLCAPAHREIVRLRMRVIPVAEIATRAGLHVGSVHHATHHKSNDHYKSGGHDKAVVAIADQGFDARKHKEHHKPVKHHHAREYQGDGSRGRGRYPIASGGALRPFRDS